MIITMHLIQLLLEMSKRAPEKERKDMQKLLADSDFVEGLTRISTLYTKILTQKELQWVIDHTIHGQGGKIMDKIVNNFDKLIKVVRSFEKEPEC